MEGDFIVKNGKFIQCVRPTCNGALKSYRSEPDSELIERRCSECGARYMLHRVVIEEFIHMQPEPEEAQVAA